MSTKRRAQASLPQPHKRHKRSTSPPFHCISSAAQILQSEAKEPNVSLKLRVVMMWPLPEARRVSVEDLSSKETCRNFEILFVGKCFRLWSNLNLAVNDQILLSLRGSTFVRKPPGTHNTVKLPFDLIYEEGCLLRFTARKGIPQQETVNIWLIQDEQLLEPDENLKDVDILPSSSQPTGVAVMTPVSAPQPLPNLESGPQTHAFEKIREPRDIEKGNNTFLGSTDIYEDPPAATIKETGRQRRARAHMEKQALKKQLRAAGRQSGVGAVPDVRTTSTSPSIAPRSISPLPGVTANEIASKGDILAVERNEELAELDTKTFAKPELLDLPSVERTLIPLTSESGEHVPQDQPAAGPKELIAGWGDYKPIGDMGAYVKKEVSIIGVVTDTQPVKQAISGDWCKSVSLVDPSNLPWLEAARYTSGSGFRINLFGKLYEKWVPNPEVGDILIIKIVKPVINRGALMGTVYSDKLKWAIYSPKTSTLHHGVRGDVPESERMNEGTGVLMCPFFVPPPPQGELIYCKRLGEWWERLLSLYSEYLGDVVQVGASTTACRQQRQHRLISETTQDSEPDGYFDCTIRFLGGFQNDNGVYSIYVTDYTSNDAVPWNNKYGESLHDKILKVEMWDAAAQIGPTMEPNGFYALGNCRMMNKNGYLEAKIVQKKIQKLGEAQDSKSEAFARLLERKAKAEGLSLVPPKAPCNIEDTRPEQYFDCSIELLHKVSDGTDYDIYVTDYTLNDKFAGVASDQPWAAGLDGQIIKVKVEGDANIAKVTGMPIGSFYRLGNLRYWTFSKRWVCRLRENGTITRLNSRSVTDDHLKELLLRKDEWNKLQGRATELEPPVQSPKTKPYDALTTEPGPTDFPLPIAEYPVKFEVVARVVDFYPKRLEDCLVILCDKCNKQLKKILKACPDCIESLAEEAAVIYRCSLFFLLRDTVGQEIMVTASDPECSLTKDLDDGSVEGYIKSLSDRLESVLGNLAQVHEGIERNEVIEPETAEKRFTIVGWLDSDEEARYGLLDCRL